MQQCAVSLLRAGFAAPQKIVAAVSGGPDSLALLLMLHQLYGEAVIAITVDHGLRAESAEEARYVGAICAARGIPHHVLHWKGEKPVANIQAAARAARYALLRDWCVRHDIFWVASAHHADDQAETLLMRLQRGTGLAGLSGIRLVRSLGDGVRLVRPLLQLRRASLIAYVADAGLKAVDDPSNQDSRYKRVQVRSQLAQAQAQAAGLDVAGLAETVERLAQAEAALSWTADRAAEGRLRVTPKGLEIDAADLPAELQRRLLAAAILRLSGQPVARGPDLERLHERLLCGGTGTLQGVEVRGVGLWRARNVPLRTQKQAARTGK